MINRFILLLILVVCIKAECPANISGTWSGKVYMESLGVLKDICNFYSGFNAVATVQSQDNNIFIVMTIKEKEVQVDELVSCTRTNFTGVVRVFVGTCSSSGAINLVSNTNEFRGTIVGKQMALTGFVDESQIGVSVYLKQ